MNKPHIDLSFLTRKDDPTTVVSGYTKLRHTRWESIDVGVELMIFRDLRNKIKVQEVSYLTEYYV